MFLNNQLAMKFRHVMFSSQQRQTFLHDLALLLADGISLHQALEITVQSARGTTQIMAMQALITLREGNPFSTSLENFMPKVVVDLIQAGEISGRLEESLELAATLMSRRVSIYGTLVLHLTYPIMVMILALFVIVFVNRLVFADFALLVPMTRWPMEAQFIAHFSLWLEAWGWVFLLAIPTLFVAVLLFLRRSHGTFREKTERLPFMSLYRDFIAAPFLEVMGLLLANGIALQRAIDIYQSTAFPYLYFHLVRMQERVASGFDKVGEVLDTGLINQSATIRLRVLSSHHDLPIHIMRIGQQIGEKAEVRLIRYCKLLSQFLLFLSATLAAVLILSIYQVGELLSHPF